MIKNRSPGTEDTVRGAKVGVRNQIKRSYLTPTASPPQAAPLGSGRRDGHETWTTVFRTVVLFIIAKENIMNRHDRRAAAARAKGRHSKFFEEYIRHLPQLPLDAPRKPGTVEHLVIHHDDWCGFYETENMEDCNCNFI